jgi:hypothetical protein
MVALLPVALTAAHLMLTAQEPPALNVAPSCRAAAVIRHGGGDLNACLQAERRARATLDKQWRTFSRAERTRCDTLATLGGPPSYVELLTCLQMAKSAENLRGGGTSNMRVQR